MKLYAFFLLSIFPFTTYAVNGSGTSNYIPKWTAADTIGNSALYETGGNVGIGTNTPTGKFGVSGAITTNNVLGFSAIQTGGSPVGVYIAAPAAMNMGLFTNWGERVRITSTGSVGIGTTSPTQKLDVNGYVKGTGLCIGTDCRTSWPSGGSGGGGITGSGTTGYLSQWTGTTTLANSPIYTTNGKVSIGTTNSNQKFGIEGVGFADLSIGQVSGATGSGHLLIGYDVAGKYGSLMALEDNIAYRPLVLQRDAGNVGIGAVDPQTNLQIQSTNTNNWMGQRFINNSQSSMDIRLYGDSSPAYPGTAVIAGWNEDVGIALLADNAANIDNGSSRRGVFIRNGNVGIGNASPNYKLQVTAGDIMIDNDEAATIRSSAHTLNFAGSGYAHRYYNFFPGAGTGSDTFSVLSLFHGKTDLSYDERVHLASDGSSYFLGGNLGVGTNNPSRPLTINAGGSEAMYFMSDSAHHWSMGPNVGGSASFGLADASTGALKIKIDTNGDMCLGKCN